MEGDMDSEATRKANKTNFSIDSLLEKKLGGPRGATRTTIADSIAKFPVNQSKPRFSLTSGTFSVPEPIRATPFMPSMPPNLAVARWPFLHGPPPPLGFSTVSPIWAMAAQAAAATGMAGPTIPPFMAPGLISVTDARRTAPVNKAPPVKKYKCDVCAKAFSRSNTLVTHKRIHSGEKPFACEHCGRAFRQPGNLTRHRLTHTTVKPYVCTQCGKAFNRASNLHTHMRTHTDYRPYVCPFCAKAFHQKIDMKIHSYTHTGEKPFRCTTCHKGFTLSSTLSAHRRTHCNHEESIKSRSCEHCGKDFLQRSSLKSHILSSHPGRSSQGLI